MPTQTKPQNTNFVFSALKIIIHFILLTFALAGLVILLIAVYHTLIYAATNLWTTAFLAVLPALTFVLALGVIFLKQPVHNLLCLISIFFTTVGLYLYVGAEFLAFLFLIVYVGAIAILFLFVIMLLHLKKVTAATTAFMIGGLTPLLATVCVTCIGIDDLLAFSLEGFFIRSNAVSYSTEPNSLLTLVWYVSNQFSDVLLFSDILYRANALLFFIISMLLLTAMLGAIVLATSATDVESTTDNTAQNTARSSLQPS